MSILRRIFNRKFKSLGWVNLYENERGKLQTSSIPKATERESLLCRSLHPKSKYVGTVELFIRRGKEKAAD